MIRRYNTARVARNAVLSAALAGAGLAGLLGATAGAAHASVQRTAGFVTVTSCNSADGTVRYTPGLTSTAQNTTASLSGFIAGCKNQGGFGKLTASMFGSASLGSENFTSSGTFVMTWPTGTQSQGTLVVSESNGAETISGEITSGPFTGGVLQGSYVLTSQKGKGTTASPVTSQTFLTSTPLSISENTG
jgi:hypothetical protein